MTAPATRLRLLVIGGGRFAGRFLVEQALAQGHQVTVFNRGQSGPVSPGAVALQGDRRSDLSALGGGEWDAVIDFCGYLPREVTSMAACLAGRVGRYAFVSSLSVYADASVPNDESSLVGRIDDIDTEVVDGRTYGPLKALCEQAVSAAFGPAGSLVVRPGLIVGPRDPTERFSWWPARLARAVPGEPVLCPGSPSVPIQGIDARDLAAFILKALTDGTVGIFNAASPADAWRWGDLIDACEAAAGVRVRQTWVGDDRLLALGVEPWKDLPLWLPATGEHAHFLRSNTTRAHAAGLRCRPLSETVADTLAWWRGLPDDRRQFTLAGLSPERERAVLDCLPA